MSSRSRLRSVTPRIRERSRVDVAILLLSAATWIVLLADPGGTMTVSHCPVTDSGASLDSLQMLLAMNPISSLAAGWAVMLVAMMAPTLITAIHHVRERSFKRRRARSVMFFVLGYAAIWMAAGGALIVAVLTLNLLAPRSYLPALGVGVIAFIWQCSPVKQRCLNRGHNHSELAAFGIAADLSALRFGITHGIWCVGSCWALMLFPMLLPQGHFAAMAAVTFVMTSERLERPRSPSWRLHFPTKLIRIVVAQTRIRMRRDRYVVG